MTRAIEISTASIADLPIVRSKWEREYEAFRRLFPQLLATHRGQYVAIHDGAVFDSGDDEVALALRVFKKVGNVDIHVGWIGDEPMPIAQSGVRREIRGGQA